MHQSRTHVDSHTQNLHIAQDTQAHNLHRGAILFAVQAHSLCSSDTGVFFRLSPPVQRSLAVVRRTGLESVALRNGLRKSTDSNSARSALSKQLYLYLQSADFSGQAPSAHPRTANIRTSYMHTHIPSQRI